MNSKETRRPRSRRTKDRIPAFPLWARERDTPTPELETAVQYLMVAGEDEAEVTKRLLNLKDEFLLRTPGFREDQLATESQLVRNATSEQDLIRNHGVASEFADRWDLPFNRGDLSADFTYEFSISCSASDPFANESTPTSGARPLYLWLTCAGTTPDDGLASLQADLVTSLAVLGFDGDNGTINIGSSTSLLLAVPGCPYGPAANTVLGHWTVWDTGGYLCLGDPQAGSAIAVGCDETRIESPRAYGFASDDSSSCPLGANGCPTPGQMAVVSHFFAGYGEKPCGPPPADLVMADAAIDYWTDPNTSTTGGAGVWVALGDQRLGQYYIQSGWWKAGDAVVTVGFVEWFNNAGIPGKQEWYPVNGGSIFWVQQQPDGLWKGGYDGVVVGGPSTSAYFGSPFVQAEYMAEVRDINAAITHVPGTTTQRVHFVGCRFTQRGGTPQWASLSAPLNTVPTAVTTVSAPNFEVYDSAAP